MIKKVTDTIKSTHTKKSLALRIAWSHTILVLDNNTVIQINSMKPWDDHVKIVVKWMKNKGFYPLNDLNHFSLLFYQVLKLPDRILHVGASILDLLFVEYIRNCSTFDDECFFEKSRRDFLEQTCSFVCTSNSYSFSPFWSQSPLRDCVPRHHDFYAVILSAWIH